MCIVKSLKLVIGGIGDWGFVIRAGIEDRGVEQKLGLHSFRINVYRFEENLMMWLFINYIYFALALNSYKNFLQRAELQ